MKKFKMVYNHELPSGNVYVLYDKKRDFYIETTSMQDVNTKDKSHEVLTTLDKNIIKQNLVPIEDKWLIAVSTQYGCPQKCLFCLVPTLPFKGNLSNNDIWEQLEFVFDQNKHVTKCDKIKVGFARMGEPQYNWKNILQVMRDMKTYKEGFKFLPCYNTILPKVKSFGKSPVDVIKEEVMEVKNYLDGFMHIQISTNSTNEDERKHLFGGQDVVTIEEMKQEFNDLPNNNRLITLNFICGAGWELDANKLEGLNPEVFCVKLTPLNVNSAVEKNSLEDAIKWNWDNMFKIKNRLDNFGLKTIIDVAAMCELDLCCGNLVFHRFINRS